MDPIRHQKAEAIRAKGGQPYAARFLRSHMLQEAKDAADETKVTIAGRVVLFRDMGKMTFAVLQDHTGRLQIAAKADHMDEKTYKDFLTLVDLGDFIGIEGERFTTQKGEPTVRILKWTMLSKALRQPPEKWHGINDQETLWRKRYLDLLSHRATFDRFLFRSRFTEHMRRFYWDHDFVEVETPVLVNAASGALATPFQTHHNAYDTDVFLRIAPETYLKECIVGGFDRVFEVARVFRNEGLDPSHLQDFTMLEHYAAYWDYRVNMQFIEDMLTTVLNDLVGSLVIPIPDRDGNLVEVDFTPPWPRVSLREAIQKECGIDFEEHDSASALREAIKTKGIRLEVDIESLGRGNLIDQLYKKVSRPKIVRPTFIIEHPLDLSPLARRNDENPNITDRFQLVVSGWEIVNGYSELVDPVDQAQRFEAQSAAAEGGDSDAHRKDDDFVTALEYGCPPCSGIGIGIDRIVALLTQQPNLRDVVLFPLMKPDEKQPREPKKPTQPMAQNTMASSSALPDEKSKRFVAILNKKAEPGKLMNALGHMTAGLSALASQHDDLCFLRYEDQDGNAHAGISHYPFIVLKADNANQIRQVRNEAMKAGIPFTDFTSTMTVGTSQEQRDATKKVKEADLDYYGICLFGNTDEIRSFTKKFSIFS